MIFVSEKVTVTPQVNSTWTSKPKIIDNSLYENTVSLGTFILLKVSEWAQDNNGKFNKDSWVVEYFVYGKHSKVRTHEA